MNTQLATTTARVRNFFHGLRSDRRGAEFVEVLIVLAIVALGGLTAMNAIKTSVNNKGAEVSKSIDGIK